jgi:hypothetical protein
MLSEQRVLDLIAQAFRKRLVPLNAYDRHTPLGMALRTAAMNIVREAEADQRAAARTASMVGASITRGRTRL